MDPLNESQLEVISKATFNKTANIGLKNATLNKPHIKKSILDLKDENPSQTAIVISAGPSLRIKDPASKLLKSNYKGVIVAVDGSLGYCLRNGLIPHYVVTVDPHPTRIVRWFGDPDLEKREIDDYFKHQDIDTFLNVDEIAKNRELIKLVNKYGKKIKAIISTSVSPNVTQRCIEADMELYWWSPLYDDYDKPDSFSRKIFNMTKVPCMVTGGNCGTSAWVFTKAILKKDPIAMVGMDFSYSPSTPLQRTQYFKELQEIFGANAEEAFIKVYNPFLKETWHTDPTYYWYRENFLKIVKNLECTAFNCTEGGILFGDGIIFISLEEFIERFKES